MSRIAVFTGRKHHTDKLINIYNQLEQNGHEVFWLTCNNSLNLDSPLEFLVPNNRKFVHVYDQQLTEREKKEIDSSAKKIIGKTKHLAPYFSPFWVINSAVEMSELLVLFDKFLKESQVECVIVLHNANFFSRILSHVAKKQGIPVFGFQEGMLRSRDQESFNKNSLIAEYTTKTFCWSRSDLEQIQKANGKTKLSVGGLYHLDYIYDAIVGLKKDPVKKEKLLAFVPTIQSEYMGNIQQDALWLESACNQLGIRFVFKPHPFEEGAFGVQSFGGSIDEILVHADYIVSQHSTVMIEAAVLGKNVAELNRTNHESTESLAGEAYKLIKNKQDLMDFIQNGFSSNKWVKSMGYKVGNQTELIVKEIEKCL